MGRTASRSSPRKRDPLGILEQDASERLVDLRLVFLRALDNEFLFEVGGQWDTVDEAFVTPRCRCKVFRVNEAQVESARAFGEWISARREGRARAAEIVLEGGRGSGKSVEAVMMVFAIAIAIPDSRCFLVSTANTRRGELERIVRDHIPRQWRAWSQLDLTYKLPNGSTVTYLGADDEDALRQGGYEVALANELQLFTPTAYATLVAGIRNVSQRPKGLLVAAMNPATKDRGQWTNDHLDKIDAGELNARRFKLEPKLNQFLERGVVDDVDSLIRSVDAGLADADALGIRRRLGEIAVPAFQPTTIDKGGHIGTPFDGWPDVTRTVTATKTKVDGGFTEAVGTDFQVRPHCCGLAVRFYRRGDGKLVYHPFNVILAEGREDDLAEAMLDKGHEAKSALAIADSSGAYQNVQRVRNGIYSHDILREYGFTVVAPVKKRDPRGTTGVGRNPDLEDSLAQLYNVCTEGRLIVHPKCAWLIESLRRCKVKRGASVKMDDAKPGYSHIVDCLRYVIWWAEPPRAVAPAPPSFSGKVSVKRRI